MPALIIVSEEHADLLLDEFGRYRRDYDLHAVASAAAAETRAAEIVAAHGQVAIFVSDSVLPDAPVLVAFGGGARRCRPRGGWWWRTGAGSPRTARRSGPAWPGEVRRVPADAAGRAGRGVPPRGDRAALRLGLDGRRPRGGDGAVVTRVSDGLTLSIRDFLDRMGMPGRVHAPESDAGVTIRTVSTSGAATVEPQSEDSSVTACSGTPLAPRGIQQERVVAPLARPARSPSPSSENRLQCATTSRRAVGTCARHRRTPPAPARGGARVGQEPLVRGEEGGGPVWAAAAEATAGRWGSQR